MVDEESTVHLLTDLGFCASEAKVYFALSRMDKARIIDVAKIAQLDRAETYRIASKLERKGYLIRMIAHPVEYRSIPMTYLLRSLLKKKKGELIQFEKKATKILQHSLLEDRIQLKKEEYISLIPILEPVFPDVKKDISNVKRSIDLIFSIKLMKENGVDFIAKNWLKALKRGVTITLVMEQPCEKNQLPEPIEQLTRFSNFDIRFLSPPSQDILIVLDNSKTWIKTSGESYFKSSWLISSNSYIVELVKNYFLRVLKDAVSRRETTTFSMQGN